MSRFIPEHPKKGTAEAYAWAEKMRAAREKKKRLRHQIRQAGLATEQEFFGPGGPLAPKAVKKHRLNPGESYNLVCAHNGCTFHRSALSKKKANQEAVSHLNSYGHEVHIVKKNPGAAWHEGMAQVAGRYRRQAPTQTEKHIFAGMEQAHKDSAVAARKLGMNPNKPVTHAQALAYAKQLVKHEREAVKRKKTKKNPIAVFNPPKVAGTIYNNAIEIKAQKTGGPLKGHYKHIFDSKKVKILGLTDGTVLLQHTEGKPLWMTRKDYERSGRKH